MCCTKDKVAARREGCIAPCCVSCAAVVAVTGPRGLLSQRKQACNQENIPCFAGTGLAMPSMCARPSSWRVWCKQWVSRTQLIKHTDAHAWHELLPAPLLSATVWQLATRCQTKTHSSPAAGDCCWCCWCCACSCCCWGDACAKAAATRQQQ